MQSAHNGYYKGSTPLGLINKIYYIITQHKNNIVILNSNTIKGHLVESGLWRSS